MPAKKTNYQEQIVTSGEYEVMPERPPLDPVPDAVDCCRCLNGNSSLCQAEQTAGAFISAAAAQTFVFWSG